MSNQRALTRFAMPVVAMVAAAAMAGCGKQGSVDPELTATLIQPNNLPGGLMPWRAIIF